jgi:hypothetical protein
VNYILFVYFRTLPPQFPQDPPSITVQPLVNHQWVDPQGKLIGCPNLNSVSLKNAQCQHIDFIFHFSTSQNSEITEADGNLGTDLGQAHKCGRVKSDK